MVGMFHKALRSQQAREAERKNGGSAMDDPDQGGSQGPAVAGLAIAAVLLVVGLWLAHALTASSKMQDCLMSGRTNCNVIEPAR
jgi:hypothetical protein